MSPRFALGRENVPCVAEVVNRSLKADCTDFSLDLGLVQYQYELKLFKWTIQSIDYKWRKYRLETYKFLLCTVLATVLYHMALKLPWGIYLLERDGVRPVAQSHQRKINFGTFFLPEHSRD